MDALLREVREALSESQELLERVPPLHRDYEMVQASVATLHALLARVAAHDETNRNVLATASTLQRVRDDLDRVRRRLGQTATLDLEPGPGT